MKSLIESLLKQGLSSFLKEENLTLPDLAISVEHPRDLNHGDFSTNIAMVLAKSLKLAPRKLAERLISYIPSHEFIESIDIAGAGFINFRLSLTCFLNRFEQLWTSEASGVLPVETQETVVIDYSSPNLAKEMHVGHLRSTIIGDAISRILELKGYKVIRQNHVGDWGTQFGMLLAHLDEIQQQQSNEVALKDLESFYKESKNRFDTDPSFAQRAREWVVLLQSGDSHCLALWRLFINLSLAHCQAIYARLGVLLKPSDVQAESFYNEQLPKVVSYLREKGLLIEHEGAQCVFLDEFKGKNQEPLPIIVQKSDGGFLYASTDLAAIWHRQTIYHANRVLYVVDARQTLHFQQLFALAYQAGIASPTMALEHISFGMVLDKSGKPYKSREGGVTKLAELLDEAEKRAKVLIQTKQLNVFSESELNEMARAIGIASVKYADLSKHRTSDYIFDWDTMLSFEGNTAPYILYAYTRIQSLFLKSQIDVSTLTQHLILEQPQEIQLLKHLVLFPETIDSVSIKATPHLLCNYLYELASLFSSFYENCPILNVPDDTVKQSRLRLAHQTARILKQGLNLLGIDTLNRM